MKINELGEKNIIELFKKNSNTCKELNNQIGEDDCAVIDYKSNKLIYTSDILTRTHHLPEETKFFDIGWKTIAVNLSDIASMGATPLYSTTSITLPNLQKNQLKQLAKGMKKCSSEYNLCQTGGDISRHNELIIDTSIIGEANENILYRKNASPNQFVAVTNELGNAGFGLKILKNKLDVKEKVRKKALSSLFKPKPRVKTGKKIAKYGGNAAIDISDGLSISLKQLSIASGNGFKIKKEKIPINDSIKEEAKENGIKKEELYDEGGDYELLFTTSEKELIKETNSTIIGQVINKKEILFDDEKKQIQGYRHF